MNWIYLSHTLSPETPAYGGRESLKIESLSAISEGCTANSSRWSFANHLGTHIDSPHHFVECGITIDKASPEFWNFLKICLIDCPCERAEIITVDKLQKSGLQTQHDMDLLLVRTGFEKHRGSQTYWEFNPGFDPQVGSFLRQNFNHLRAIGMDTISLSSWQNRPLGREAHKEFLDPQKYQTDPIWIIEDMKLAQICKPLKQVLVSPLRVVGSDGAPCTVFAQEIYE